MSIFEVRHQPRAHKTLQRALESGRLPHAYLFHGPEGRVDIDATAALTEKARGPLARAIHSAFKPVEHTIIVQPE